MDSSSISHQTMAGWIRSLASGVPESQIDALRQISNHDTIDGLATQIVALAGNDEVGVWASEAMESAVQPNPTDLPKLMEMIQTSADGEVCYWAATMLGRLGLAAGSAVGVLENCLLHSNYLAARERSVWALSQIGPRAIEALPSLRRVADQDEHSRLSRLATDVAGRLTEESERFQHRKRA